jgi:uncharacterized membrane protein
MGHLNRSMAAVVMGILVVEVLLTNLLMIQVVMMTVAQLQDMGEVYSNI